ncbi:MAG: tetratricopeptide repeat protein [Bacteroidota bacterium]
MKKNLKIIIVFTALLSFNFNFSQETEISPKLLDQSCECIKKISLEITTNQKNDSIKSCINVSIMADQIKKVVAEMGKDMEPLKTNKDTVIGNKSYQIVANENFDDIQKKLFSECPYVKELLMSNNQKNKNSVSNKKKALEFYSEGQKYFNEEKYDLALVEYNKAVKSDPKFAFAWDNMGISYRKLNRYKEAIECYKKSLEFDPKGTTPLMNMAVAYNLLNLNKESIETYQKFLKLYPEDPEGFYGIARIQGVTGDYANALENIFRAYELYEKNSSPYVEDAINVLREIVVNIKKDGKKDIFNKFAEKHGLKKIED